MNLSPEEYPVLKGAEENANNWRALAMYRKGQLNQLEATVRRYEDAIQELKALDRDCSSPEIFDRAMRDIIRRTEPQVEVDVEV